MKVRGPEIRRALESTLTRPLSLARERHPFANTKLQLPAILKARPLGREA